jgi:hypothetical protein
LCHKVSQEIFIFTVDCQLPFRPQYGKENTPNFIGTIVLCSVDGSVLSLMCSTETDDFLLYSQFVNNLKMFWSGNSRDSEPASPDPATEATEALEALELGKGRRSQLITNALIQIRNKIIISDCLATELFSIL